MQKEVTNEAFWLVNEQTKSEIANHMWALDGAIYGAMIFLVQFGMIMQLSFFFKETFVRLWNNLLLPIYSKLHSKWRDYLYKCLKKKGLQKGTIPHIGIFLFDFDLSFAASSGEQTTENRLL